MAATVKIGFVPTYRGSWGISAWCEKMRNDSIQALKKIPGIDLRFPRPHPDGSTVGDPQYGYIPDGAIWNLDQAEILAEYYRREKVDGIIIAAFNFGDERSAVKVAEILRVPMLLYATKEPPVPQDRSLARVSDSYCGTLSIAAGLKRRKIPFQFAGILLLKRANSPIR